MSDSGIKVEVHLIQNFAPSNLNRDDTGQPKSATFGGFRRARISSQCAKRSTRNFWRKQGTATVGERTKRLQQLIDEKLCEDEEFRKMVSSEQDRKDGVHVFTDAYYAESEKNRPEMTKVLTFVSPAEVSVCAEAIKKLWEGDEQAGTSKGGDPKTIPGIASIVKQMRDQEADEKGSDVGSAGSSDAVGKKKKPRLKKLDEIERQIKTAQVSADIALFGRMLAEQPGRNTDGSCQVAHPISTHRVDMEMDFYTAVDDLNPAEETGAGMMGVVGFNSACYYRYALVDRDQLARNVAHKADQKQGKLKELSGDDYAEADRIIRAFLEAMVYAVPTGKQNSFAAQNLPSFGLFVKRRGGVPVSLANAFAKPVRPGKGDEDLVGLSVEALTRHWEAIQTVYGNQGVQATTCFHIGQEARLNGLKASAKQTVKEAIDEIVNPARGR